MNNSSRITVAYITIGANIALRALEPDARCKLADRYSGEIGIIDEVTQYYALIDYVYDALTPEERDLFGVWDYEVSETFGRYYVQLMSLNQQDAAWNAVYATLSVELKIHRLHTIKASWENGNANSI